MLYINNLTGDASQQFTLTGIPSLQIGVVLNYRPRVQRWFMDVNYGSFVARGIGVVASPNLLRQWKNIIPFGIACVRNDGLDPYAIGDFLNQIANLYLLDSADVATVEETFFT